ncbi:MAG: AAA family ATPase [Lachnospiraceae bacterium]|nr:AAA family ATPase [Lachnospiraceae bacterium]
MDSEKREDYGFIEYYFPGTGPGEPFRDGKEQLAVWQRFVDMLCMIALVQKEHRCPSGLERIGCLLSDEELMKTLEPRERSAFPEKERVRAIFDSLIRRGEMGEEDETVLPLWQFLNTGRLAPLEILAFLLAACADLNRKYERIFGVLQEDRENAAKPIVGLTHDLGALFLSEEENEIGTLLDTESFLNRYLLEEMKEGREMSRLSRPLSLRREVLEVLLDRPISMEALARCGEILEAPEELPDHFCHRELFERLTNIYAAMSASGQEGLIHLLGAKGSGRRFLAQTLGTVTASNLLILRLKELLELPQDRAFEILHLVVSGSIFENALIYLCGDDVRPDQLPLLQQVLSFLQSRVKLLLAGSEKAWSGELHVQGSYCVLAVEAPGASEQKFFWQEFAGRNRAVLAEDVDLTELVSKYNMTPGRISRTVKSAVMEAPLTQEGFLLSKTLLEEQIRIGSGVEFGDYAVRLQSPFTWEDLQVSEESRQLLTEACDRVRCRSIVNDEFGFGRKLPYGNGTSIVLYGPPGTGKTMAAQVLANELGLDIYRIDLSQIGSKYIGETEKNLGAVFEAARGSNAILFFDEADALFTKRTDVASSNDRYANAETAYLLQKIEEYSGVSILATNVMQNFDSAFKRRMTYMIPIEQPDEAARLRLWEQVFPKETPMEENIDFSVFARVAELTGSGIKSEALSAAYRAAAEHRKITNDDLIRAVEAEYRRIGRMGIGKELYGALYTGRAGEAMRTGLAGKI